MSSLSLCLPPVDDAVKDACANLIAAEKAVEILTAQCSPHQCTEVAAQALTTATRDVVKWEIAIKGRLEGEPARNVGFIYEKPLPPLPHQMASGGNPNDGYGEQIMVGIAIIAALLASAAIYYFYRAFGGWPAVEIEVAQIRRKIAVRRKPKPGYHRRGR